MPLKSQAPRASLKPDAASGGSRVPDGEYSISQCRTGINTYNGTVPEGVPAIIVTYSEGGSEYEQAYKAGDNAHLVPTEDGAGFTHPDGRSTPTILRGGAANYWLQSVEQAGFEVTDVPEGVHQFEGLRVRVASKMIKLGQEKKDTPTPLVDKIIAEQKGIKASAKPSKASNNGDLDTIAVDLLKQVLGKNTLRIENVGMKVWMAAGKAGHGTEGKQAIKNLITAEWIKDRPEFETDGDEVAVKS